MQSEFINFYVVYNFNQINGNDNYYYSQIRFTLTNHHHIKTYTYKVINLRNSLLIN